MKKEKIWIWKGKNWPKFNYSTPNLLSLYQGFGQLQMALNLLSDSDLVHFKALVLEEDALCTSALEGISLDIKSLQSAICESLGLEYKYPISDPYAQSLTNVLLDVKNTRIPMSESRLFAWHKELFVRDQHGIHPVKVGRYRSHKDGEIQVISGTWDKEHLHYIAPPAKNIELEMTRLLLWINTELDTDPVIKSAIVHLWFLLIHPFNDGNRRLARDISDYVLSASTQIPTELFSLAFEMNEMKSSFYGILDSVCLQTDMDISAWIQWYLEALHHAVEKSLLRVQTFKKKMDYKEKLQNTPLNSRQLAALYRLLNAYPLDTNTIIKTGTYARENTISKPTSARDLKDMKNKHLLKSKGKGRGAYYVLSI